MLPQNPVSYVLPESDHFSMHDFVTTCIDHLKNIVSLSYADFPHVDTFH